MNAVNINNMHLTNPPGDDNYLFCTVCALRVLNEWYNILSNQLYLRYLVLNELKQPRYSE